MLPSRAWELLFGALLAAGVLPAPSKALYRNALSFTCLTLILFAMATYSKDTPFPGAAALPPVLGTAMIILANTNERCVIGHLLSWRPLVFTGLLSYSLYLWHWPLTVFTKYHLNRELYPAEIIVLIAVIFALSYLTWLFIEQPVRQRRAFFEHPTAILATALVGGLVFISFGMLALHTKGLALRLPEEARQYTRGAWDKNPDTKKCHSIPAEDIRQFKWCVLGI